MMCEFDNYFEAQIMSHTNFVLKMRFTTILHQCHRINRGDKALIRYINEMEYRDVQYSLEKDK